MRKYKQIAKRTSKNLRDIKGHFIGFEFNKVAFRGRKKSAHRMYLIDNVIFVNQENRHIFAYNRIIQISLFFLNVSFKKNNFFLDNSFLINILLIYVVFFLLIYCYPTNRQPRC
jgi:hypothetical protein